MPGALWYGMFDVDTMDTRNRGRGAVIIGSVVAACAGVCADPVQSRLGIPRRRQGAFWIHPRRCVSGAATDPSLRASVPLPACRNLGTPSRVWSASSGT